MLQDTIQQTGEKLIAVRGTAIFGVAGAAALSQQYEGILGELLDAQCDFRGQSRRLVDLPPYALAACLQEHFLAGSENTYTSFQRAALILKKSTSLTIHLARTLIALPCSRRPVLFRSDEFCNVEEIRLNSFEAIGVGQRHADPFLAFLKRVLWRGETPSTEIGELTVVWALQHAIEVNTGGVADPKHVLTLRTNADGTAQIERLDGDKISGYENRIQDIERSMHGVARDLPATGKAAPIGPEPEDEIFPRQGARSDEP